MAVHLALDIGKETIGLAACDEDEGEVRALYTVTRTSRRRDVAKVVAEIERLGAARVVVGLAVHRDGSEGTSARRARAIGDLVAAEAGVEVVYQDEFLSTFEAEQRLLARGLSGRPMEEQIDAEAARVILEAYLEGRG